MARSSSDEDEATPSRHRTPLGVKSRLGRRRGLLASDQRLRVALQAVGESTDGRQGAVDLHESLAQVALERRLRAQYGVGAIESRTRVVEGAPQIGHEIGVHALDERVRADLLDLELVELLHDVRQVVLQLLEGTRDGRYLWWLLRGRVALGLGRIGKEVEGDVELTGEQVAAAELGPQPFVDQLLDPAQAHARGFGDRELSSDELGTGQAFREELHEHGHREIERLGIDGHPHLYDLAHRDAPEVQGRAHRKAAHGAVEHEQIGVHYSVGKPEGLRSVGEEREHGVGLGGRPGGRLRVRLKGDASHQDGYQRLRPHLDARRADGDVDAAGVPEPRAGRDVLVVRGVDEDGEGHPLAILVELFADDLADGYLAEVDQRARVDRAQLVGAQEESPSRLVARDHGRLLEADEIATRRLGLADIDAYVAARQQGTETRHAARSHTRTHHEESGVLDEKALHLLAELGGGHYALTVRAQRDSLDQADLHVLVLDLGLARLEAFRGLEGNGDHRPTLEDSPHGEPATHEHGHDGHDPDELRGEAPPRGGHRLGQIRQPGLGSIGHVTLPDPRSGADRRSRRRTWSARPPPRRRWPRGRPGCS